MRTIAQSLLRVVCIAVILFAATAKPADAAAMDQCHVCTGMQSCPIDPSVYDAACKVRCGEQTYAGGCGVWAGPGESESLCHEGSIIALCYYPM